MDKLFMQTVGEAERNIEKIANLFPEVVTEIADSNGNPIKAVNWEKLRLLLGEGTDGRAECYDFTWVGKKAALIESGLPTRKTLRPIKSDQQSPTGQDSAGKPYLSSGSVNWETTQNLYIEGDNLDVLKLLTDSYSGKIKMIYIDPPYNKGKDYIYKDKHTMSKADYNDKTKQYDESGSVNYVTNSTTNPRFHSDWCSNIFSRLRVARNLLSDDGVILINIDENEVINLSKICTEVFGATNDLGTIIWDKRNPKGEVKGISYQHEYILVYAKNKIQFFSNNKSISRPKKNATAMLKKAEQLFKNINKFYTLEDANKDFKKWILAQSDFSGGEKAYKFIDDKGDVYRGVSMAAPDKPETRSHRALIHPVTNKPCPVPAKGWRLTNDKMDALLKSGQILFGKDESTQPERKYLLKENMSEALPSLLYYGGSDADLIAELGIPFDTPKVVSIVKEHILSFTKNDDIILDFYSGSATTAHAVMQLNAEIPNSKRQFIMVQYPERTYKLVKDKEVPLDNPTASAAFKAGYKNICEIGKERIRRAGARIAETSNTDVGFRVFKLEESLFKDNYYSVSNVARLTEYDAIAESLKNNRTAEDLLYSCILRWGASLSLSHTTEEHNLPNGNKGTLHIVGNNYLIACFENNLPESVLVDIAYRRPQNALFRESCFNGSSEKMACEEIFKMISPNTKVKVL